MEEDVDEDMATDENFNRIVESPLYSSITEDESPNPPEYTTQSGSDSTKRVYRNLPSMKITRIKPYKYDYKNSCLLYRVASPPPTNKEKPKTVLERIYLYRPRRLPANNRKAATRPEGGPLLTAGATKAPVSLISIPTGYNEADLEIRSICDVDDILNEIIHENIAIEASHAKQSNKEKSSEQAEIESVNSEKVVTQRVDPEVSGIVDSSDVDSEIIEPEKNGFESQTDKNMFNQFNSTTQLQSRLVVNREENDLLLYVKENKLNLLDLVKALKSYKDKKDSKDKESQTDQEKKMARIEDPTNQPSFLKSQSYAELFKISQYNKKTLLGYYEQARKAILGRKGDMETVTKNSRQQEKELEQPREKEQKNVDQNRSTLQQTDRSSRTTEHTERLIQNSRVPISLISLQQKQLENQKRFRAQQMQQQFLYQQHLASLQQPQQPQQPQRPQQPQFPQHSQFPQHPQPPQHPQQPQQPQFPQHSQFPQQPQHHQHHQHLQQPQQPQHLQQPQRTQRPQQPQQRFLQPYLQQKQQQQQQQQQQAFRNVQHWDRSPQTAPYSMPNTFHHSNHHGASSRRPVSRSQQYRYATERSLYEMQQHEHQNLQRLRETSTFPNTANYYTR